MKLALQVLREALLLVGVASILGFGFNLIRPEGLSLVARANYEIYAPCPEVPRQVEAVALGELAEDLDRLVLVDARQFEEYQKAHIPGARSIPYHPLRAPNADVVASLKQLGASGILVYGDTDIDSGRLLGAELSSAGLRGVRYLQGGFSAWIGAGRKTEGEGKE